MITYTHSGSFDNLERFLQKVSKGDLYSHLEPYARMGVSALAANTPVDSGLTSASWDYDISITKTSVSISWTNGNVVAGTPVAVLLQYGHGTGTGGYVQGRDYINPAMEPVFKMIADQVWKAVVSA